MVWGRCWEAGGAPAFWPWIQIVRACRRQALRLSVDVEQQIEQLASPFDKLRASGVAASNAEPAALSPYGESEQDRFRLFDTTANL